MDTGLLAHKFWIRLVAGLVYISIKLDPCTITDLEGLNADPHTRWFPQSSQHYTLYLIHEWFSQVELLRWE